MGRTRTLVALIFAGAAGGVAPPSAGATGGAALPTATTLAARDPAALQAALSAAIAAGAPTFTVPPGLYNFSSIGLSLHIYNARDMLIDGTGAELTFTGGAGFRVTNATRVELRGFTVDADPWFSSQGVVRDGARDGKWFNYTVDVEPGFPPPRLGARTVFWHSANRSMMHAQVETTTVVFSAVPLGGGAWRVGTSFYGNPAFEVPDGALTTATPVSGDMCTCLNCSAVVFRSWRVWGSAGMAFRELGGEGGNTYDDLLVARRPGTTRLLASSIDVLHSTSNARGPTLVNSRIGFAGDDLFAVHCELAIFWARAGAASVVVIDTGGAGARVIPHAAPGDALAFYNLSETMEPLGRAKVARVDVVTDTAVLADAARAWDVITKDLKVWVRDFRADAQVLLVTFAAPLDARLGNASALVQFDGRCGAGARIEGSELRETTGGVRFKAPNATMANSSLTNAYGVRYLPEVFWTQSMASGGLLEDSALSECGCAFAAPHCIELPPFGVPGLVVRGVNVTPAECT